MKQLREGTDPGLCSSGWGKGRRMWAGSLECLLTSKTGIAKTTNFTGWFWKITRRHHRKVPAHRGAASSFPARH